MTTPSLTPESPAVRFVLDGKVVTASAQPATTVLEYLRETIGRTGTKEGCAEGDCGACTVTLGELSEDGSSICYKAVNSCIRFLPTIDGKELVTVESLQDPSGTLHPVQQAVVDQHASQCGFCTPGFVMSLFALYLNQPATTRDQVVDALSGNLCRCTGYRPLIEAGCRMSQYAEPKRWSRAAAQSTERLAMLRSIQRTSGEKSLTLPDYQAPRSVDELASALQAAPNSLLLAGGTDIGLWVTKQLKDLPPILYLGDVAELKQIRERASDLWIGAAVTLSDAWSVIVARYPVLAEYARRFASPPVCNSGTLGGNVANGSPIGDSMPVLIALSAAVELRSGTETRHIPLEQFYLGYQRKDLRPGEFLVGIVIPTTQPQLMLGAYKISKRVDQDISAVCSAFAIVLEEDRVVDARLVYGGMAAIPKRAAQAEAALVGRVWSSTTIDAAIAALAMDFAPLTDMRASSEYRLLTAGNLLRRFYLQQSSQTSPVRTFEAIAASSSS